MKNFVFATIVAIVSFFVSFSNVNNAVVDTNTVNEWQIANIYDISFENGVSMFNNKEILCSNPLSEAIERIITNDACAYASQIDIEVLYIESEDLYIANLLDIVE